MKASATPTGRNDSFLTYLGNPASSPQRPVVSDGDDARRRWLLGDGGDGGVFAYATPLLRGRPANIRSTSRLWEWAARPKWRLLGSSLRRRVFAYGDAGFFGRWRQALKEPIVGMASTPTTVGYGLVASDGGSSQFGDAQFYGSTGRDRLNTPIVE